MLRLLQLIFNGWLIITIPFVYFATAQRDSNIGNQNIGINRDFNTIGGNRDFNTPGGNRDFNTLGGNRDFNAFTVSPRDQTFFGNTGQRGGFGTFNQNPRTDFTDSSTFPFANTEEKECPQGWDTFKQVCYRFVRSPIHNRDDARRNCQAYGYGADLLSVNSIEEHKWITRRLTAIDPQGREWYVSGRQSSPGNWVNADGTQLILDQAFLQDQPSITSDSFYNYLAYSYSERRKAWGLLKVTGQDRTLYICEIPLSQVPYIDKTLDDRGFDFGVEIEDPKKIARGPYFIQEPKDTVFDTSKSSNGARSYVALSCLAAGWPAPTYRWFKEEYNNMSLVSTELDPLRNANYTVSGGMLIIDNPADRDRGNYHCIASNEYGSVISETVSITFGYINDFPRTLRDPEKASQYWGAAIYCDPPTHYPDVLYSWSRRYFPNLVEEDQRVFVSYDGNLYISSVDASDKDNYICHVQSKVSSTGKTGPIFALEISPSNYHQELKFPNNFPKAYPESPKAGDEVRLECVAFGYPVPSYYWTRKGASIPLGAVFSHYNRVLTISKVKVEDQGEYICHAANSRKNDTASVTLSIQAAPNFTLPLGNRHMDKGDDLIWTCEAFGIPDVSYQWYKNGKLLSMETVPRQDIGRYLIQDNVLTIRNLDGERDSGMYQCRANNTLTARFSAGQLRVLFIRPNFKKTPLSTETLAAENGNVTIKCEPEAAPRPKFVWRKDGNIIGAGGRRRILPNGSLFINPVSREDQGVYTCIAQNSLGSDESSGRLSVLQGPSLVELPAEYENYTIGSHLFLRCRAEADPSLDIAIVWKLNGFRLDETSYRIRIDPRNGYLEIFNLTLADKGDYECEVNTWVGSLKALTHVNILGPPGPPGGVKATDITARTARVIWTDGAMNGAPAYLYTIQGKTQWDPVWRPLVENVEVDRPLDNRIGQTSLKEKLIGVISPWSVYEFRVQAANRYGFGPPSEASPQYNTPPDRPFIAPRNVRGGGGKTGSLTILWDPLQPKDQNAPGIYYKVFWRQHRNFSDEPYHTALLKNRGNTGIHVVHVPLTNFYLLYDVKVQAWNSECDPNRHEGCGPESPPVQIYSAEDMPQAAPAKVLPLPYNSTAINVTWTPVDESRDKMRGKLIGYRIRYWRKIETNLYDPEAINYLSRSTKPHALILGLLPNTYYYVQVMAYNSAGPGPASEPQFERTLKKAPQRPPINVKVSLVNPSTIKITWRYLATTAEEEALTGFKVRIWDADQDMSTANDTFVDFIDRSLEAEIGGLLPAKKYIVRVLAYSPGGDGKMSPPQEIILGDPQALKNTSGTKSSLISKTDWLFLIALLIYFPVI